MSNDPRNDIPQGGPPRDAWHYAVAGTTYGPVTWSQVMAMAHAGQIHPDTPIIRSGTETWQPLGSLLPPAPRFVPKATSAGNDAAMRMLLPVGRSGWAIAAGYLGLVCWVIFPLAPFALITAELGRRQIAKSDSHGMGRVVLGFAGGAIGMVVMVVVIFQSLTNGG